MSRSIRTAGRLGASSFISLLVLSAGVSSATASNVEYPYLCKLPVVGTAPATVGWNVSSEMKATVPGSPFSIDKVDLGTAADQLSNAPMAVLIGSHFDARILDQKFDKQLSTAVGGTLPNVTGQAPAITLPMATADGALMTIGKLVLNLRATGASGAPTVLPPVTKDLDGVAVTDSDGDPTTFNVYCKPDPARTFPFPVNLPDSVPPSTPGPITITNLSQTTATLNWGASSDNIGIGRYVVTAGPTTSFNVPATQTSYTLTGLKPNTQYDINVRAFDTGGLSSANVAKISFTTGAGTPPPSGSRRYDLTGSVALPTLARGSQTLKGTLDLTYVGEPGAFSGDVTFAPFNARLLAVGSALPVAAKIALVPAAKTTGTLVGGVLTAATKVRTKVTEARIFGAIPIALGNECQTKAISDVTWTTGDAFLGDTGGELSSTFAISDLNGCLALTGFVDPATAGTANTVRLTASALAATQ